jgi:hypothetical protein
VPWGAKPSPYYEDLAKKMGKDLGSYLDVDARCSRLTTTGSKPGNAVYPFDAINSEVTVEIPAGSGGRFYVYIDFDPVVTIQSGNLLSREHVGASSYRIAWNYMCSPEGKLELTPDDTGSQSWSSNIVMNIEAILKEDTSRPNTPYYIPVNMGLSYSPDTPGGVNLTVGYGPVQISGTPGSSGKSHGLKLGLRINFNITNKRVPPPPPPRPVPPRKPVLVDLEKTIYFEHEGDRDLDQNTRDPGNRITALQAWADRLKGNKELFEAVGRRYVAIQLKGHASPTDTDVPDWDLSDVRIKNVQRRLRKMLGETPFNKEIWFVPEPRGHADADGWLRGQGASTPVVPRAERDRAYLKFRRVEIFIIESDAVEGIERMRQGLPPKYQ